jgi:hypothetical protein
MSIFNETLPGFISEELIGRQNQMGDTSKNIKYLTSLMSRTAWVRMTSGVNIKDKKGDYTNELAKENVITNILGGTNLDKSGEPFTGYKTKDSFNRNYRHGIRPLPGITEVIVQSLSPNGSLRKVTVKFNVWDIKQLDLMEILYMRPGFTICVEWGWSHKLSTGDVQTLPNFGESFLEKKQVSLMELYAEAYDEVKKNNGNYDICIGKIQNYNWNARTDGGYDCEVTIVTYGEILESLKCNYIPFDSDLVINGLNLSLAISGPYKAPPTTPNDTLNPLNTEGYSKYSEGILPGVLSDLYNTAAQYNGKVMLDDGTKVKGDKANTVVRYNMFTLTLPPDVTQGGVKILQSGTKSVYITLSSFIDVINRYILLHNPNGELVKFSTIYNEKELKCLAHPFSMSTDPNVCLIRPDVWLNSASTVPSATAPAPSPTSVAPNSSNLQTVDYTSPIRKIITEIKKYKGAIDKNTKNVNDALADLVYSVSQAKNAASRKAGLIEISRQYLILTKNEAESFNAPAPNYNVSYGGGKFAPVDFDITKFPSLMALLRESDVLADKTIDELINIGSEGDDPSHPWDKTDRFKPSNYLAYTTIESTGEVATNSYSNQLENITQQNEAVSKEAQISQNLTILKDLNSFFVPGTNFTEGYLGNIYLNLDFLYSLIAPKETEVSDSNRVNNIYINKYINDILLKVENSIGSINQFEIYSDYTDNIARIIDKNLLEDVADPFKFQVDNTYSIVKNYSIKSMIFPDQMSIFAISTQTKSGVLGEKNQQLIAYNRGIQDRIIKESNSGANYVKPSTTSVQPDDSTSPLFKAISTLAEYSKIYNQSSTT